jgi:hypothetical protein
MNLQYILSKNSPWVHMELEVDVLGIARKLVKYSFRPIILNTFDKNMNTKEFIRNLQKHPTRTLLN